MSCAIAVGRMMAAACNGGTNSDISGSAITPRPRKPPLEMPSRQTPMTATAMKAGIGEQFHGHPACEEGIGTGCAAAFSSATLQSRL